MSDNLHLTIKGVIVAVLLAVVLGSGVVTYSSCSAEQDGWSAALDGHAFYLSLASDQWAVEPEPAYSARTAFAPTFQITGVLPDGSLGLPGEMITWVITVTNSSSAAGTDLIITDKLPPDLRVDSAEASRGEAAVSEQMVIFTLPELAVGDQATFFIYTTVLNGPASGVIRNQAALVASSAEGPVSQVAQAEVSVPTGLPPTGYAPAGEAAPVLDKPSLELMVAIAMGLVGITAAFVYYRGQRR